MHIVVFIKSVPETNSVILKRNNSLDREHTSQIMNPADLTALEEAFRIRDEHEEKITITVCTMGPESSKSILLQAGGMGADKLYLLSDPKFAGSDTYATASVLRCAVKMLGRCDLILCGRRSTDGETGQVGQELAALLGIPCADNSISLRLLDQGLLCNRKLDHEYREELYPLPSVVTVYYGINSPRLPSIIGLRKMRSHAVEVITAQDLRISAEDCGMSGSPTRVVRMIQKPFEKRVAVKVSEKGGAACIVEQIRDFKETGVLQ